MKKLSISKGFTLIELLVAVAVLVVVGSIVAVILITSLRGSNKTATITQVRQNGTYAISQMSKVLRDAQGVSSLDGDTQYSCDVVDPPLQYKVVEVQTLEGGFIEFACDTENDTIASSSSSLLDSTAVDVVSCYFTCSRKNVYDAPTIGIYFTLLTKHQENLPEFTASSSAIPFKTAVTLRNITR